MLKWVTKYTLVALIISRLPAQVKSTCGKHCHDFMRMRTGCAGPKIKNQYVAYADIVAGRKCECMGNPGDAKISLMKVRPGTE